MERWYFVSNYMNHHQIAFCDAMYQRLGEAFVFVQLEDMEEHRRQMGWREYERPYIRYWQKEAQALAGELLAARLVLFGGSDEEEVIRPRLDRGLPTLRYSESIYKRGRWRAVSPRGLWRKYQDHICRRKDPVYMLCAGARAGGDFGLLGAYPGKLYKWGYFPPFVEQDIEALLDAKEGRSLGRPKILWVGRMIDWKHPELALEAAGRLADLGLDFSMELVGQGPRRQACQAWVDKKGLDRSIEFTDFQSPEAIRVKMERADIFLMTSDRQEGWGAVANEAMNSGCALVANSSAGAIPYLLRSGMEGYAFRNGQAADCADKLGRLLTQAKLREDMGRAAYGRIRRLWNPGAAADALLALAGSLGLWPVLPGLEAAIAEDGPCSPAPYI